MALEIEHKFLLKRLPNLNYSERIDIYQLYLKDGSRIRSSHFIDYEKTIIIYHLTKKTKLGPGIYEENERGITSEEFKKFSKSALSFIHKSRYIFPVKKLKWEIDVYSDMNLVIAEIEIPKVDFKYKIPKEIKSEIILDVTKFPEFTNKSLSESI